MKSRGISEHPPVTSSAEAGSPEGTLPLEGVPLYLVIHRMQALKQGSDGGQPSPPKALPMSELINIDHFQYILNTLFFFYSLWYPFYVLHLNVAIIGCFTHALHKILPRVEKYMLFKQMYLQHISYYGCLHRSTCDLTRLANRRKF